MKGGLGGSQARFLSQVFLTQAVRNRPHSLSVGSQNGTPKTGYVKTAKLQY